MAPSDTCGGRARRRADPEAEHSFNEDWLEAAALPLESVLHPWTRRGLQMESRSPTAAFDRKPGPPEPAIWLGPLSAIGLSAWSNIEIDALDQP
jgi:hypothetical protein